MMFASSATVLLMLTPEIHTDRSKGMHNNMNGTNCAQRRRSRLKSRMFFLFIFCFILMPPSNSLSSTPPLSRDSSSKPILVVGATGRVGRLVVSQLLEHNHPVRALVRNTTKAEQIFGDKISSSLQLFVADLGHYDDTECQETLKKAVDGCDCIILVSGTMRFSKWTDFLPWRLFRTDVSSWCDKDRRHPFYPNYKAQNLLVDLAEQNNVTRFVRLTGLTVGLPAFDLVSILFSGLLSMTSRYHALAEQYLRQSSVPHVILRPGGLSNSERNKATTSLQVDATGVLAPPARVGRADVAALAIASCDSTILSPNEDYTLAVRWVGEVAPKAQATKHDGQDSAEACLQDVADTTTARGLVKFQEPKGIKPYGAAVGVFFYSLTAVSFKIGSVLLRTAMRIFRRT